MIFTIKGPNKRIDFYNVQIPFTAMFGNGTCMIISTKSVLSFTPQKEKCNTFTCSPSHWKAMSPGSVLIMKRPMQNCIPRPQNTVLHDT